MRLIPVDSGVVVLAAGHNPTILHASFLKAQRIVGEDWEEADRNITTPAVSVVSFKNGVRFTVEPNKFQVLDVADHEHVGDSRVAEYAKAYLRALPHVRYAAVGMNLTALIECDHASDVLKRSLLREGPWTERPPGLQHAGVKLTYSNDDGSSLNVTLDPGEIRLFSDNRQYAGISVHGNYHSDLAEPGLESALSFIEGYPAISKDFVSFLESLKAGLTQEVR